MLSFTPTDEQQMLVKSINEFACSKVRPAAHEADEACELPVALVRTGWEMGVLAASVPEKYGGLGDYSVITNVLAAEEFAYGELALALEVFAPGLVGLPVLISGTDEQKENLLPRLAEPTPPRLTAALVEPGIHFDAGKLKTSATRNGQHYCLNGAKCMVPLGADAQMILVYAQDTETGMTDGYLVERGADGLTVGEREKLMGIRALPTYALTLGNVRVDAACKLGGQQGTRYARLLSHSRVALAAMAVGVARGALEYARDYAKERVQFGAPIATRQAIAFMLAEMAIEVDATRLMVWEAAWKLDSTPSDDATRESYLAKKYADKAVLMVTDGAVQTLGGHGYIRDHPVERWLRNARGFVTLDGLAMA
ncbi:MAG TPA: acyl-CoA dehydrogenase family protein [Aggregatilineales bacterium]|nr:acyl-CoA dehydrogenase family protein [Aggregatilineales bacterium]